MTRQEEIFNYAMQPNGIYIPTGKYEIDSVLIAMLDVMRQYIDVTNQLHPHLPKVNIFYANKTDINACAFKYQGEYFISINVGAVIKFKEVFDNLSINKEFTEFCSIDDDPINTSASLLYFAMIFLVAHEHSHIRFGHCDLLNHLCSNDNITFLSEATSSKLINDGLFRQTLEYDADCCAIANLINRQLLSKDYHDREFKDFIYGISLSTLACYIVFKIFDNGIHCRYTDYDLDNLEREEHPRPGLRINYLMGNISSLLCRYYDKELDIILESMFNYIKRYEFIINGKFDITNLEMGIAYTRKGSEHLRKIHNNWKRVREMLLPFTNDDLAEFEEDTGWNKVFID